MHVQREERLDAWFGTTNLDGYLVAPRALVDRIDEDGQPTVRVPKASLGGLSHLAPTTVSQVADAEDVALRAAVLEEALDRGL